MKALDAKKIVSMNWNSYCGWALKRFPNPLLSTRLHISAHCYIVASLPSPVVGAKLLCTIWTMQTNDKMQIDGKYKTEKRSLGTFFPFRRFRQSDSPGLCRCLFIHLATYFGIAIKTQAPVSHFCLFLIFKLTVGIIQLKDVIVIKCFLVSRVTCAKQGWENFDENHIASEHSFPLSTADPIWNCVFNELSRLNEMILLFILLIVN